jgi:hypothetical protein
VWDVALETVERTVELGMQAASLAVSPDGAMTAVGDRGGRVSVIDIATGEIRFAIAAHSDSTNAVAYSPDGATIASVGADGTLALWRAATGEPLGERQIEGVPYAVRFSPGGEAVVVGGEIGVLWFDVAGGSFERRQVILPARQWVVLNGRGSYFGSEGAYSYLRIVSREGTSRPLEPGDRAARLAPQGIDPRGTPI